MSHNRFKFSAPTLLISIVGITLLYLLFSIVQPVGLALGAALLQSVAPAQTAPPYLNYQGTLRNAEGQPISGVHKLTFRVYADVTDPMPEALWMEEHSQVTVRNGQFSVLLGDSKPISPTIFHSPDRFIGITLDTLDEMVPRQRFASAPYALNADALDGMQPKDFALAGHVHSSLSAPDGDPGQAVAVNNDGNVGVGVANPERTLDVGGTGVRVQSAGRTLEMRADFGAVDLTSPTSDLYVSSTGGNKNVILNHTGGRVGVNTAQPNSTLDVNGDVHVQGVMRFGASNLPPVIIRRYDDLGQDATVPIDNIPPSLYDCTTAGWSIHMDVDEDDEGPYTVWTYVEDIGFGESWFLRSRHWTDAAERSKVDVLCFLKDSISVFEGNRYDQGFN